MITLTTPLSRLPNLELLLIKKLAAVGIRTAGDLLYFFPNRYEDFSTFKTIAELSIGETVTVKAQIVKIKTTRTWKRKMTLTEAYVTDDTGLLKCVWFNYPAPLKFLYKGKYVQLSGKITSKKDEMFLQHPNFQLLSKSQFEESNEAFAPAESVSTGSIVPVYPEPRGLKTFVLRRATKYLLGLSDIEDFIPKNILLEEKLMDLPSALHAIHFPQTLKKAEEAKRRFAFEKMFLLQLKALEVKSKWEKNKAVPIPFDESFIKKFVSSLPFKLTNAQKKSAWQIIKDLETSSPMNRLLEGDVGSGKTVVATMSALSVVHQKFQAALLSPTEVLSIQHYHGITKLLSAHDFSVALLTASQSKLGNDSLPKKKLLQKLLSGQIDLVIGTHALLQEKVKFKNLALVIIDEQHRFGVKQRAYLQQQTLNTDDGVKGFIPHLLTMTATPIPRTLSLAIFGNLDLSIIDEYPKGRKPIITKVIPSEKRASAYEFIKKQILSGRQAFIICPLVEETSKMTEVKAATQEHQRLQEEVFKEFRLGLLHGRMKPADKEEVMRKFKDKEYEALVSTSVVEVGVDVPNSTIMLIEGAERFGLSQLHQFRGRVGRAEHQSYCFLITSDSAPETTGRLKAMEKTTNGFRIAEYDLKLRGPGQFLGTLQSGAPDIAMESLSDIKLIQAARLAAQRIIAFDSALGKFPLLKAQLDRLDSLVHWE